MLPILLTLLSNPMPDPVQTEQPRPVSVLFDMTAEGEVEAWRPVHDTVMGGRSSGGASRNDAGLCFSGVMSLENNGGFASLRRAMPAEALAGSAALALRVRGDGSVWKVGLQTPTGRYDVNWQAAFPTVAGEWTTVALPYEAFTPTWRGQLVTGMGAVAPERARTMRIVIGEKQKGPYALEIAWIGTLAHDADNTAAGGIDASIARGSELAALIEREADAGALRDAWRWSERVLVVSEPRARGGLSIDATLQLGELWRDWSALAERELRVVHLIGDDAGWVAGRELGAETVRGLRQAWGIGSDGVRVGLVGKDGGLKASWDAPVAASAIFERIDAMPMRRGETAERRAL